MKGKLNIETIIIYVLIIQHINYLHDVIFSDRGKLSLMITLVS